MERSGDDRPVRNTVLIEFEMPVKSEFAFVKQLTLLLEHSKGCFINASFMITWLQIQNSRERSQLEKYIWEASAYERYVKKYLFSQISRPFLLGLVELNLPSSWCPISSSTSSVLTLAPFLRKGNYSLSQRLDSKFDIPVTA